MKTVFLILGGVILLGAGCSSAPFSSKIISADNQQTAQEQQKKIDELTKKVETLSASLPSTSTASTPIRTIVKEIPKKDNSEEVAKLKARVKELENQPIQTLKVSGSSKINYSAFIPHVVKIVCQDGAGSGTIISPNAILTNYHVIEGNTECLIGFTTDTIKAPSEWIVGKVTAANSALDRALIQVDTPLANKTIKKCNATDTQIADDLIIIGYPSAGGNTITITNGNISGFIDYYIKTSAKINPGNSGGAAIHESGCFLGIPTAYIKGQAESLGLIIDERIGGAINDNNASLSPIDETYRQEVERKRQEELLKQQEQERSENEKRAREQAILEALQRQEAERRAREQAALEVLRLEQERLDAELKRKQEKLNQTNALVAEFQQKVAEIDQQILAVKQKYYADVEIAQNRTAPMASINGQINKLTAEANAQIDQLNLQKEQLRLDYLAKINAL